MRVLKISQTTPPEMSIFKINNNLKTMNRLCFKCKSILINETRKLNSGGGGGAPKIFFSQSSLLSEIQIVISILKNM